jgi:hypothetical protein
MKILFVDHAFHKKTRSSAFFVDVLNDFFDVRLTHVDPTDHLCMNSLRAVDDVDLVVLWQMDFLAPIFLARGLRTVVVPMFDGSSLMPDLHWIWARHAHFINFSRLLHERVRRLGPKTLYVKYFVSPVSESSLPTFDDGLRVFLWQRRPEHGINLRAIETLFGDHLAAVHVHDAPDDPTIDTKPYLQRGSDHYRLTISEWFEDHSEYERALARCNVFIGPRRSEGIGLGFIEAMSRGMLVVAPDQPTHNEYVANWVNGVLFNPDEIGPADFHNTARMARLGWQTARDGHQRWLAARANLVAFLQSTPEPPPAEGIASDLLARGLVRAYLSGQHAYRRYLLAHADTIAQMSGIELRGRVTSEGQLQAPPLRAKANPFVAERAMPWLPQNRFCFAGDTPLLYRLSGQFEISDGIGWFDGQSASFGFRIDFGLGAPRQLRLSMRHRLGTDDVPGQLCVALNGWTVGFLRLLPGEQTVVLPLPLPAIVRDNILSFQLSEERSDSASSADRTFGVESWAFE